MTLQTGTGSVDERIAEIEQRARRRWRRLVPITLAAYVVALVLGLVLAATHHSAHGHHHSAVGFVIGVVVGLAVVAVVWAVQVRSHRRTGLWGPPLTYGLPRAQRREVGRDLRKGRVNADPVLREVERRTAERFLRLGRFTLVIFVIVALIEAVNTVWPDRPAAARIGFGALTLLFLAYAGLWVLLRRRMQRVADAHTDAGTNVGGDPDGSR